MNAAEMAVRVADEDRKPLEWLVHVHKHSSDGLVIQDENVKVTAALVKDPPVVPAFAYRFDARPLDRDLRRHCLRSPCGVGTGR